VADKHNLLGISTSFLYIVKVKWEMIMNNYKRFSFLIMLSLFILINSGCSVVMAAKQPSAKNIDLFRVGTPRSMLLAEFGLPTISEVQDGKKHEIYKFIQGYSAGARTGRAVIHGVADVLTLGLWEVIATPAEGAFSGDEIAYDVRYDEKDYIDQIVVLKGR